MSNLALAGALACALAISACTPENIAKTCQVGKLAQVAIDAGRGGQAERNTVAELRDWCASKGHPF